MNDYRDSLFARALIALLRNRKRLVLIFLVSLVASTTIALFMPKYYSTHAAFQIKARQSSSPLSSLTKGLSMLDPSKSNSDVSTVMAIFDSRQLAVDMIHKFGLMKKYKTKWEHFAIKRFQNSMDVTVYADNIVSFQFTYPSQDSVKIIADTILAYVDAKSRQLATSKARSDYLFLTSQLDEIQAHLSDVGDTLVLLSKTYNVADFENQIKLGLEQLSRLDEEITQLKSQESMMEAGNAGSLTKLAQLRGAISSLNEKQTQILEGRPSSSGRVRFNFVPPYEKLPELGKKLQLLDMETQKSEAFLKLLLPSIQDARTKMVENAPSLTFIDPTYRPGYKAGPKRALIVVLTVFPVFLFSCITIVLWDFLMNPDYNSDPGRGFMRYIKSRLK